MMSSDVAEARALLLALQRAGAQCFLLNREFFLTQPTSRVEWGDDLPLAIEEHRHHLRALVSAQCALLDQQKDRVH